MISISVALGLTMKAAMNEERAYSASILVTITFHFDARRLGFLAEALQSLSEFPVMTMHIVIVTNTVNRRNLLCFVVFALRYYRVIAAQYAVTQN